MLLFNICQMRHATIRLLLLRHAAVQIHQKRHATVQMFLMRHAVIQNHLMRHDTVQNRLNKACRYSHCHTFTGQEIYHKSSPARGWDGAVLTRRLCTCVGPCQYGPGGCPPASHARFPKNTGDVPLNTGDLQSESLNIEHR